MPLPNSRENVPEVPDTLTLEWLEQHLDMRTALGAYEQGIKTFGPSSPDRKAADFQGKLDLVRAKAPVAYEYPAILTIPFGDVHEALCMLPKAWLEHAKLSGIQAVPTEYFCTQDYGAYSPRWAGEHFIGELLNAKQAEAHFAGKPVSKLTEGNLRGPAGYWHYAPGQYVPSTGIIKLWQEPSDVRSRYSNEALREYGRELVVHEALHAVFHKEQPLTFFVGGAWLDYEGLTRRFHELCQQEPESASEYSETYAPWRKLSCDVDAGEDADWKKSFRVPMAVWEEFGELASAVIRGWGATPGGKAMRPQDRPGIAQKVAFIKELLAAPVRMKSPVVDEAQGTTKDAVAGVIG